MSIFIICCLLQCIIIRTFSLSTRTSSSQSRQYPQAGREAYCSARVARCPLANKCGLLLTFPCVAPLTWSQHWPGLRVIINKVQSDLDTLASACAILTASNALFRIVCIVGWETFVCWRESAIAYRKEPGGGGCCCCTKADAVWMKTGTRNGQTDKPIL
jgi:hypothetical protein